MVPLFGDVWSTLTTVLNPGSYSFALSSVLLLSVGRVSTPKRDLVHGTICAAGQSKVVLCELGGDIEGWVRTGDDSLSVVTDTPAHNPSLRSARPTCLSRLINY